jgi:O-antigen/teichoic acid export membrane protein
MSVGRRVLVVAENTARHLAVPATNLVVSYAVISASSPELWGRFAILLVVVGLCVHLLAWGNKEYLLRAMSADAGSAAALWQRSVLTRCIGLPVIFVAVAALGVAADEPVWLAGWIVLAFVYQSFDVVVLFNHRFRLAIAAELVGLATTLAVILGRADALDESVVIAAWVAGLLVKTIVLCIGLARVVGAGWSFRVDVRHVRETLPFVLLGLSGLLQSRIDLFAMAALADSGDMGRYQVTIGIYVALQAVAGFVIMPFVGEFYQRSDTENRAVASRLAVGGVAVALLSVPVVRVVLNGLYRFDFPWLVFVLGALVVVPVYRYLPHVYLLYKRGLERRVVAASLAGAVVNLVLAVALIPEWSVVGGLLAAAGSQWFTLACFELLARHTRRA